MTGPTSLLDALNALFCARSVGLNLGERRDSARLQPIE
jgi:hypothetical protein